MLGRTHLSAGGVFDGVGVHWHRMCPRHRLDHGHRLGLSQPHWLCLSHLCSLWLQSQERRVRNDWAAGPGLGTQAWGQSNTQGLNQPQVQAARSKAPSPPGPMSPPHILHGFTFL